MFECFLCYNYATEITFISMTPHCCSVFLTEFLRNIKWSPILIPILVSLRILVSSLLPSSFQKTVLFATNVGPFILLIRFASVPLFLKPEIFQRGYQILAFPSKCKMVGCIVSVLVWTGEERIRFSFGFTWHIVNSSRFDYPGWLI